MRIGLRPNEDKETRSPCARNHFIHRGTVAFPPVTPGAVAGCIGPQETPPTVLAEGHILSHPSVPDVPFVILNSAAFKQLPKLFLERSRPMMLLLIANVFLCIRNMCWAD